MGPFDAAISQTRQAQEAIQRHHPFQRGDGMMDEARRLGQVMLDAILFGAPETTKKATSAKKSKLDSLLAELESHGWKPGLTPESYVTIVETGLSKSPTIRLTET